MLHQEHVALSSVIPLHCRQNGGTARGSRPRYLLRTRVHHLVAARFSAKTIIAVGKKGGGSDTTALTSHVPTVANAIATFELVARRGGRDSVVWRRTLTGVARSPDLDAKVAQQAVGLMLTELAGALRVAAAELPRGNEGGWEQTSHLAVQTDSAAADVPFVNQRALPDRATAELRTLLISGREVSRQEVDLATIPSSGTDEWVLSRRATDGRLLATAEYRALARRLAAVFDLRRVSDLRHYHFFGLKAATRVSR